MPVSSRIWWMSSGRFASLNWIGEMFTATV